MPENKKLHKLSIPEIKSLNRQGYSLDESGKKFYALSFLINDKQNAAADPRPFKIKSEFLSKLVPTALNRAWLPDTLPNGKHIRPKPDATAEEILQFQRDYAGGEMVGYHINPITNNASVIIDVFPEYQKAVEDGKIKPFVSPMIGNWAEDENGEVVKGEILHLQSVGTPGYDPEYAKFQGTCKGNFNECLAELKPLAAAGKLNDYRNSSMHCPKQFFSTLAAQGNLNNNMSLNPEETTTPEPNTPADVGMVVGELKKEVEQVKQTEIEMEAKVMQEIAQVDNKVETLSSDVAEIKAKVVGEKKEDKTSESESESTKASTGEEKPAGAAGSTEQLTIKKLEKELNSIKKEREAEKEALTKKERERQVAIIVKKQLLTKEIGIEDKEKITKEWMEKKSPSNPESLADLSLLAEDAEKRIFTILPEEEKEAMGASGLISDDYSIEPSSDTRIDFDGIESSITEENY